MFTCSFFLEMNREQREGGLEFSEVIGDMKTTTEAARPRGEPVRQQPRKDLGQRPVRA